MCKEDDEMTHAEAYRLMYGSVPRMKAVLQQRRAGVPRGVLRVLHDVVARQRGHRDVHDRVRAVAQRGGVRGELLGDAGERGLVEVDQVDLVHRQHEPRHAQQRQHGRVSPGLLDDALGRGCPRARTSACRWRSTGRPRRS